ncbi:hypothetical protein AAMO2058_001501600 [Amorphochlora amoebiformis]
MGAKPARKARLSPNGSTFHDDEKTILDQVYQDLASRSPGPAVNRATFLSFFKLPGIIGELLFDTFDTYKDGTVNRTDFMNCLGRYYRGTIEEKIGMLFDMYNDRSKLISKVELTTLLHSMITPETALVPKEEKVGNSKIRSVSLATNLRIPSVTNGGGPLGSTGSGGVGVPKDNRAVLSLASIKSHDTADLDSKQMMYPTSRRTSATLNEGSRSKHPNSLYANDHQAAIEKSEVMVESLVQDCFNRYDTDGQDIVTLRDFQRWIGETPRVCRVLESLFYTNVWCLFPNHAAARRNLGFRRQSLEHRTGPGVMSTSRRSSTANQKGSASDRTIDIKSRDSIETEGLEEDGINVTLSDLDAAQANGLITSHQVELLWKFLRSRKRPSTSEAQEESSPVLRYSAYLYKVGQKTGALRKRWCLVQDSLFYEYKKIGDPIPSRVIFLEGYYFHANTHPRPKFFSIEMKTDSGSRLYYVDSKIKQQEWIEKLCRAGKSFPVQHHYRIEHRIGKGRFSTVHFGIDVRTNEKVAVKVIEKKKMSEELRERESLRTEIAILKIVNHPNIIHMREIFESSEHIHIVMDYMEEGDLFDHIIKCKILPEYVSRVVIFQLLSAISYLHRRGIVHRDLKPENILCTHFNLPDIRVVIADFGLSKFARPSEVMKMPCGTLAYIAPEVLSKKGYSKSVDLWSIGVIFYLLLRGGLPFDGKSKADVIQRTLNSSVSYRHPRWKYVSPMAQMLLRRFLLKDPRRRISISEALAHPWFNINRCNHHRRVSEVDRWT